MNKKLIALAIAGAFVAPVAMADASNVTITGQMHFSLDSLNGKNAAGTDLTRKANISSNASNIIFKGTEDLGNGMNAYFNIQTYFSAGGTGNSDTTFGAAGDGVGQGNTYVGLSGKSWGAVQLGKMESPFKILSRKVDLFNNQIGDTRNFTARASTNTVPATGGTPGWDTRPNNTIAYMTPNFNGFVGTLAYFTNASTGAAIDASATANANAVSGYAGSATYENGPIFAGAGYERHNLSKYQTGIGLNDEHAWRVSGGYNFGTFKLTALYHREGGVYQSATNTDASRNVYGLGGAFNMGSNTLKAQYYHTGNVSGTSDTGANLWALGVDHAMSKRTSVYAAYARTDNKNSAAYSAFGGGHGDNPGTTTPSATVGAKDPSGFSVGVIHNF